MNSDKTKISAFFISIFSLVTVRKIDAIGKRCRELFIGFQLSFAPRFSEVYLAVLGALPVSVVSLFFAGIHHGDRENREKNSNQETTSLPGQSRKISTKYDHGLRVSAAC